jgi:hypothetical protein
MVVAGDLHKWKCLRKKVVRVLEKQNVDWIQVSWNTAQLLAFVNTEWTFWFFWRREITWPIEPLQSSQGRNILFRLPRSEFSSKEVFHIKLCSKTVYNFQILILPYSAVFNFDLFHKLFVSRFFRCWVWLWGIVINVLSFLHVVPDSMNTFLHSMKV